jgi:transposase InsO family protein
MSKEAGQRDGLPERWSAKAKTDVVLRLFRGESVADVSREIQVPAHEIETWRRDFLDGGVLGLRRRGGDPEDRLRKQAQAKVGELTMKLELAESAFHSEGHKKVRARLKAKGIGVGRGRVLRIMRVHHLLAPHRRDHQHGDRAHRGTIVTDRPDELWGTDATKFYTRQQGWCWFFAAIDHCTDEIVGWHVAKRGDRWAALEPIRQGVQHTHGD